MSDHEWCRDVQRDEAVRAAEDAAAVPPIQRRDLPEQVSLLWASLGDIIGRVVRLEGEFDAGQDEEAAPAEGGAAVGTCNTFCGERECERTDPTQCKRGEPQPARGGLTAEEREASTEAMKCMTTLRRERDAARARVAVLEAAPPPRGWLTAEEREEVQGCLRLVRQETSLLEQYQPDHPWMDHWLRTDAALSGLLARETPPRVKMPPASTGETPLVRDLMWGEAIRAAGGEVE